MGAALRGARGVGGRLLRALRNSENESVMRAVASLGDEGAQAFHRGVEIYARGGRLQGAERRHFLEQVDRINRVLPRSWSSRIASALRRVEHWLLRRSGQVDDSLSGSRGVRSTSRGRVPNSDVRIYYNARVSLIPSHNRRWIQQGLSAEQRARGAYQIRHSARMEARAMMDTSDVATLRARDLERYGNPNGPTFNQLVGRARSKGLRGDQVYESIVESSARTDPAYNAMFGIQ